MGGCIYQLISININKEAILTSLATMLLLAAGLDPAVSSKVSG